MALQQGHRGCLQCLVPGDTKYRVILLFLPILIFLLHSVTPVFPPYRIKSVQRRKSDFFPPHSLFYIAFPNKLTSGSVLWVQVSADPASRVGSSLLRELTEPDTHLRKPKIIL